MFIIFLSLGGIREKTLTFSFQGSLTTPLYTYYSALDTLHALDCQCFRLFMFMKPRGLLMKMVN